MSTAYILDGFELFYFDLAEKEHSVENHTFSGELKSFLCTFHSFDRCVHVGLKKHTRVKITITSADKSELDEAVESLEKRKTSWRKYSPVSFILWWKRRTFNKQLKELDPNNPQSAVTVMLHGAKPLSDYDIKDFKYMSKIPVGTCRKCMIYTVF